MRRKAYNSQKKFNAAFSKVMHAKPVPRTSVKATGRRAPRRPTLPRP
ncbi:MAG TPA: hypothetical protein VEH50_11450 [Methylomirabilota bacterium]|nr:hypothetical protein [Methylomirabilota bacterium]